MSEKWIKFRFGASGSSYGGLVNKCSDDFGQGKPFVTYMNVFSNCKTKDDCFEFVDIGLHEHQNVICKGDILFTTSSETPDEVGMSSVVTFDPKEPVYLNSFCFGFRFDESISLSPEFLAYLFRGSAVRNFMSTIAQGSTRYNLPKRYLFKDLYLTVPASISTQRHIGEVLGTCDEVIEQSERAAEKYRQIKAGMLADLLTRGLDDRGRLRPPPFAAPELYKDSELGPIPKEWAVKRLGDVCQSPQYGLNVAATEYDGIHGYIRITDIDDNSHRFNHDGITSPENYSDFYKLEEGDIVISRTGASVGKAYVYDRRDGLLYFAGFLIRFRCNRDVDSRFVFSQLLTGRYWNWVAAMSVRTGQPGINSQEYAKYRFAMPMEASEQRAIAERLAAVDERIAAEVKAAEKYRKVKAGLMEKLLTPPADAEIEDRTKEVAA